MLKIYSTHSKKILKISCILFSAIRNPTNKFCVLPAGVVDLGGMDVDVRGDRFVHERAETQPEVGGVLSHAKRQSHTHRLQLDRRKHAGGRGMGKSKG